MEDENLDDRMVEVLQIPDGFDDDLLWLYFENKRRSGGGNIISLDRTGDKALLVFESAEVANTVLQKDSHTLSDVTLIVRKKPQKDHGKLVLRGLSSSTTRDMLELYVENLTGMDSDNYTLFLSPGKDLVLIHLHQPATEDFNQMCRKVSKRMLDGARLTLEQVEYTDSIMVRNLSSDLSDDLLALYFESSRSGGGEVMAVQRIFQNLAKVSFKDVQDVDRVLQRPHRLEETDLVVNPYYSFLYSEEESSLMCLQNGADQDVAVQVNPVSPLSIMHPDLSSGASTPSHPPKPDLQVTPVPVEVSLNASQVIQPSHKLLPTVCPITVSDPEKRELVVLSKLADKLKNVYPSCEVTVTQSGLELKGPSQDETEKLKSEVLEFLSSVSQIHLSVSNLKADFLQKQHIRKKLTDKLKDQGLLCTYTVTGSMVVLSSISMHMLIQVREVIQSEVCEFILPIEAENEYMIYCEEWRTFLLTQGNCSVEASAGNKSISVVTLQDMEQEVKESMVQFFSMPIQKEIVISMQPAMLTYIQLHQQQLLMDMNEVMILPLDSGDGLSIQGNPTACQMAGEVISSVVSSTCTKIITVNQPGIARFLLHDKEGKSILAEMTTKFQVYINLERVRWKPLEDQDTFAMAWKMASHQNFIRGSSAQHSTDLKRHAFKQAYEDTTAHIEEAKKILSSLEGDHLHTTAVARAEQEEGVELRVEEEDENVDIYSDALVPGEQPETQDSENQLADLGNLDEDACLSLAIQMSMEANQNLERQAEEDLQKVLQLSKVEVASADENEMLVKAVDVSVQDEIGLANTAQIEVFASYTHDLVRVDIALGKKVGLRQYEEKLQHKSFRRLSAFHRRCLDLIKRKHAVDIQIQGTTAIVSGFKDYVIGAIPDLNALLENADGGTTDAEILKTVQWMWHDGERSAAVPYPPEAMVLIENAWKMKQDKLDILFNNRPYTIDFTKMLEFSVSSGRSVPISRKLLSSGNLYTGLQEDYSLLSDVPDSVRLEDNSKEYNDVVSEFLSSLSEQNKVQIVKVEKVMNRLLYSQYQLKKTDMEQKIQGNVERTLYHGTSESSVKEICIHGFNRSFCGKNATAYGKGVYFAVNSSYSVSDTYSPPNADGHKFIFVAHVLTGDFIQGKDDMKAAPLKQGSGIPVRYHSVVDNVRNPSLFVIFNDTQAYPQYLVTCLKVHK